MELIINGIVTVGILGGGLWFTYASTMYIAERKRLQREGRIDYYGNPIEKPEPEKPNWNINEGV